MKALKFDIQRFVDLTEVKFGGVYATVSVSSGITVTNGTLASGSSGNDTLMSSHDSNYSPFHNYSESVITLGGGNDYVDIDSEIGWAIGDHSSVTIDVGAGDDKINITGNQNVIFTSNLSINGGTGNDYINLGNGGKFDYGTNIIGITSTFIAEGGSGKDTIKIASNNHCGIEGVGDVYDGSKIAYPSSVYIKGGDDDDQIIIYGKRVGISGSKEITISGGTGNDLISISGDTYGIGQSTLPIDGGTGIDTIAVNSISNWSAVSIIAGSGDVISVGSGEASYLFDSTDAVTINGATFTANSAGTSASILSSSDSISIKSAWNGTVALSSTNSLTDIDGNVANNTGNYKIVDGKLSSSSDINSSRNSEPTTITSYAEPTNTDTIPSLKIPTDALKYNGHSYYVYSNVAQTWEEAQEYCKARGGHLAVINDSAENTALFNYMKSKGYNSAYFGLSDAATEGNWTWINGDSSTYRNWAIGEPGNGNNADKPENYGMFYWKFDDAKWNDGDFTDYGTDNGGRNFICEWDSVSSKNNDNNGNNAYNFFGNNDTISADPNSSVKSSYTSYEQVTFHTEFKNFKLDGDNLRIYSSSGSLTITNVRGRTMAYANADGNPIAHSYVASSSETIDRREYSSQFEVVIGADNANNLIYAGNGGSNLWGGYGGNDTLTGAAGYDEFNYKVGSGNDVIENAGDNDIVNLNDISMSDIVSAKVDYSEISATFADGGSLKITGNSKVGFLVDGVTYYVSNRSTGAWSTK